MGGWWRSFRWRLAILASVLITLIFFGFATIVDLRLNRALNRQHEARLRFLLERLPPAPFLLDGLQSGAGGMGRGPGWGRERLRQLIGERTWIGFNPDGGASEWMPVLGDWDAGVIEVLKARQRSPQWREVAVFEWQRPRGTGDQPPMPAPRPGEGPPRWEDSNQWSPGSPNGGPPPLAPPPLGPEFHVRSAEAAQALQFSRLKLDGGEWYVGGLRLPNGTLWLAQDASAERGVVRASRRIMLTLLPLVLGVVVLCSGFIATRALRPVRRLTAAMGGISEKTLAIRLPTDGVAEEFAGLLAHFNGMLERLERSFAQASRFSADAAHELKTPLTILQGELEEAVQEAKDGSVEQERFVSLLEEVSRLRLIAERLLQLAKADSGRLVGERQVLAFDRLLADECEAMAETAEALEWTVDLAKVELSADESLLRQAVRNLLSNAVKYNQASGAVRVGLRRVGGLAEMRVFNTGARIPEPEQALIFDRFTRVDASRNRGVDGLGLGLSLAREIARAHGGDLRLARSDEEGTEFVLELPALRQACEVR